MMAIFLVESHVPGDLGVVMAGRDGSWRDGKGGLGPFSVLIRVWLCVRLCLRVCLFYKFIVAQVATRCDAASMVLGLRRKQRRRLLGVVVLIGSVESFVTMGC